MSATSPTPAPPPQTDDDRPESAAERFERERMAALEEDIDSDKKKDKPEPMFPRGMHPMLRYCKPYWWPYKTFAKKRWIGRQLLEVICSEFRDRSVDYYRHALECGVTRVNGVTAYPEYIIRDSDRIDNTVHRHEPPVSNDPVLVLHVDEERKFIVVSKPGSLPVHAAGRYYKHTLLEILKSDHGLNAYAVNRLDRLTSGLMILATTGPASHDLALEFQNGKVQKEYIARVRGQFPEGEVVVDQPLLTVDRQMGLVIVTPEGKEAKTIFTRMSYDAARDQSVVHCKPVTGRTHQLRVHLQWLGYPIANDPLYSQTEVWGADCGKGGVELHAESNGDETMQAAIAQRVVAAARASSSASASHAALRPVPDDSDRLAGNEAMPAHALAQTNPANRASGGGGGPTTGSNRDYDNIDLTSPVRLTAQARSVIAKLRRQRDEAEDWIKWKEVMWTASAATDKLAAEGALDLDPAHARVLAKQEKKAAEDAARKGTSTSTAIATTVEGADDEVKDAAAAETELAPKARPVIPHPRVNNKVKRTKVVDVAPIDDAHSPLTPPAFLPEGFCTQCFVPVPDDPDPETLFIYLHALRYTTERLGTWETPLPRWAGAQWDGDWRGWDGQPPVSVRPPASSSGAATPAAGGAVTVDASAVATPSEASVSDGVTPAVAGEEDVPVAAAAALAL